MKLRSWMMCRSTLAKLDESFENSTGMKLVIRLRRSLPLVALLFVLGFSLVYACAWIQLYFQPHPYKAASEWIYANIPQGSSLAGPHWDDRLPLSIPGKDAPRYYVMEGKEGELPFYERDTKDKLNLVLKRTAKADYVIFPTPRISDSIPRVPEEYPYTTAYIQLLWAEKLGFTFVKSVKDRPSFLGLTFNDDLADESFYVYDHPKAVIFKNVERLTEDQMRERVLNPKRFEPLPTLNEILLMDAGGWAATATPYDPHPKYLVQALLFLLLLAGSFWVLIASRFKFFPDGGVGISFLGGILLSGGVSWALAAIDILPFNPAACTFVSALVMLSALASLCISQKSRSRLKGISKGHGFSALASILIGIVVVIAIKSLFPEYFWAAGELERFSLSFFSRNEEIPPESLWNPLTDHGAPYVGHLLAGWLVKITGATGSFAYELCFVMLGGAMGGVLYTVAGVVLRRPIYAFVITLLAFVPAVRGIHVVYNGYSEEREALAQVALDPSQQRLVDWLTENLKGAPVVAEACDNGDLSQIAMRAGLPSFRVEHTEEGASGAKLRAIRTVCLLADPLEAFNAMMSYGVGLLIVSDKEGGLSATRQEALARFIARRDLFAPIYREGGSVVLATAFSDSFPRAYTGGATVE